MGLHEQESLDLTDKGPNLLCWEQDGAARRILKLITQGEYAKAANAIQSLYVLNKLNKFGKEHEEKNIFNCLCINVRID